MAWTSLANAGVAAAYGAAGAYAAATGSFLLAFLGVAAAPALAWSAWKFRAARRLPKSQGPA
jgi:Flp pilus assembly protein TadB